MNTGIKNHWKKVWHSLQAPIIPIKVFNQLIRAYSSPLRFYHNLEHITDCLSLFAQTKFLAACPEQVELAIWFHDAVYNTKRSDNELKSAQWAQLVIIRSGLDKSIAQRISRLIEATDHNVAVNDIDVQMLVDVDLSILGREKTVFWHYEESIRKEYAWVSEDVFKRKRSEILRKFLDRQHIYYLPEYRNRFEEKARMNLEQAIARLEG